jgi:hypothetical protein
LLWPIAFLFFFYPSNHVFMNPGRLQVNFDHGKSTFWRVIVPARRLLPSPLSGLLT